MPSSLSYRLRRPFSARWAVVLVAFAALQVTVAGWFVSGLRSQAVHARVTDQRLLDVRYLITDSDRSAWQIVAQGFPNFTFSQQIADDARRITADLRYLQAARTGNAGVAEVTSWIPAFEHNLATAQRLVAAHHLSDAQTEVLVAVDGTAQLIQDTVGRLAGAFSARATSANTQLYAGALIALGVSAVLLVLLASGFVVARRRTAAAERAVLGRSERRFRALVQKASEVVIVADGDRRITYVTDSVEGMLGRSPAELLGSRLEQLLASDERPRALQDFERTLRGGARTSPSEWILPVAGGPPVTVEVRSANLLADPDVAGVVITVRDVTRRRLMEAQLRHQALHDPLTGLPNRTLFEDRVAQALQRATRHGGTAAVLYLDLDGFKAINDSLGHAAGDELLRTVAGRIDESLRGADTAARLGGDEFACLIEALDSRDEALTVARRLTGAVTRSVTIEGRSVLVRASIGIAYSGEGAMSGEQLIRNADLAMYKSKAEGRGQLAIFDDDLLVAARRQLDLREDLRHAIARCELTVVHQPLVLLESGEVVGSEALVRWHHAERGFIPPDQFIPVAEETGLIVPIGRWVLDRALADLAGWSQINPGMRVNVNIAPRELAEPDYPQAVADTLARHGIAPDRVTLELTESEFLEDGDTLACLHALAALGVDLSIDDFGTGQSSLARLQRLPVSQVKLDRSFLASIDEDAHTATLVRSMIELGQALGLQMVAEGIERDSQHAILREAARGLNEDASDALGQGYLFARPQAAAEIGELLRAAGAARTTSV